MRLNTLLFRLGCAWSDRKRDRGLTTPDDVTRQDGIVYGPDRKHHTLDLYRPKQAEGRLPVIVSVHGGGYIYGSTVQYQFYCMHLAQLGFAVVNFNYRLAPKYKFPAPLEDTNRVLAWVCANADEQGLDPENVFLVGDSAGAQIACQYAVICSNPAYEKLMDVHPPRFRLGAVGLNCGVYDVTELVRDPHNSIAREYLGKDPDVFGEQLDVLKFVTGDFPPTYLLSAKGDFLLSCCRPMEELLRSRGVETACKIYGGETNGHVFHIDQRSAPGREANRDETDFFRAHLV